MSSVRRRQTWARNFEFLLTSVGAAVGLGNIWRFPYLAYENGGGAFLIPYTIMLFCVGFPMVYLEACLGQFAGVGPFSLWRRLCPAFSGLSYATFFVAFVMMLYYNVILTWIIYFMFASMAKQLPWARCGNWWNTPNCYDGQNGNETTHIYTKDALVTNATVNKINITHTSPSQEYFYRQVLQLTAGIDNVGVIRWQLLLCLLLSWTLVYAVSFKGIRSIGKVAYVSSTLPYLLLTIMLVRGVTLPGCANGILYYVRPDFHRLLDAKVWADAASQIMYSLAVCIGAIITMASFNKFENNVRRDVIALCTINCCTSVYAGFVVFSVLGYMAHMRNAEVKDVVVSGPGLVFVAYPEALSRMPLAPLWSVLFFLMMTNIGMSSMFASAGACIEAILDEFSFLKTGKRPEIFRALFCISSFLITLPMVTQGGFYWLTLLNDATGRYPLLVVGILELVIISWVYGFSRFAEDISLMLGQKPSMYWRICWCFLSPVIIATILVTACVQHQALRIGQYVFPTWSQIVNWIIVVSPILILLFGAFHTFCQNGLIQVCKVSLTPTEQWGPALKTNRKGRYEVIDAKTASLHLTDGTPNEANVESPL